MRRLSYAALRFAPCLLALAACGDAPSERAPQPVAESEKAHAPEPAKAAAEAAPLAPPTVAFTAPQPWRSSKPGVAPVDPPALPTWRALVSQNQPLQVKTPLWQKLPPGETVALAMPPQSGFRCVVTPLQMAPETNDFNTKLKGWVLARSLLCSADGFRRWTEHVHTVRLAPDGTPPQPLPETGALLRERDAKPASIRHSYVLLRSDEEVRAATTGPPRILPGVVVDED